MKISKLTPGHNLLWESSRMMLPEHKEQLIQRRQDLNKKEKPILDEQQIEEFSRMISEARANDFIITVTIFRAAEISGKIIHIDQQLRQIKMITDEESLWVKLDDIVDITMNT